MQSINDIWEAFITHLENSISQVSYNVFFKNSCRLDSFDGANMVISFSTTIQKSTAEKEFISQIHDSFLNTIGFVPTLEFVARDQAQASQPAPPSQGDHFTFDNFIEGPSNRFATVAARAVAKEQGGNYNPLVIYGPSGLGKTHLLWAIHNEIKKNKPHLKLICIRGEEFTNDMYASIENGTMTAFHEKYRSADVLLIDDIHFIAGKESTQEEFFNTFNILYQDHKQIVVTCDRPPRDIQSLEERIRTRLVMGLTTDVGAPDFDTKVAIINSKARGLGFEMPTDVVEFIAHQIKSNVRQIEGTVKKLYALQQLTGEPATISAATRAISDIRTDDMPTPVTVERILDEVARTYNLTAGDLLSRNQSKNISHARKAAMYIIREIKQMTLLEIGKLFEKDHSSVVYSLKSFTNAVEQDPHELSVVNDIIKNISNL